MDHQPATMAELQEADYGAGRDYTHGSPHLQHEQLRTKVETELAAVTHELIERFGEARILELGAGHGQFTDALLRAGASVTVTEMSAPSAAVLEARYANNELVTVVHDPDGTAGVDLARDHHGVVFISVLHHIPDYLGVLERVLTPLPPGGAFYCAQDPLWYPRRTRVDLMVDRGSYLAWRLFQGDYKRGLMTRLRRLRGKYDEENPSDMVEYHVVRQGVDEEAIRQLLTTLFDDVDLWTYWSTQSGRLQKLGERMGLRSTFGFSATGRKLNGAETTES